MSRSAARMLLIASSVAMSVAGVAASFAPVEILKALGSTAPGTAAILVQLLGALYLAFAMTNWTAKGAPIGGIYSRPISTGNLVHFTMGALALAKYGSLHGPDYLLPALVAVYAIFAIAFGLLVFGPVK
ncbi:MAG: hypothetical protein ABIZ92_03630 [Vicinamibacterales bacterium]